MAKTEAVNSRVGSLKGFFKQPSAIIDNLAFRLHYPVTFVILLAFSLLVTSKQYFEDPIKCFSEHKEKKHIPSRIIDTYCWIHPTFSIENAWKKRVGEEVPYPGVDNATPNETRVWHSYYCWVCFVLFFQALFFYLPRSLWKAYEGGRVEKLAKDLGSPLLDDDKKKNLKLVAEYLHSYVNHQNRYFYFYFMTEIFNLLNVIIQMMIMDRFLGGEFTTYGWDVINFTEWDWKVRFDPMIKVFPRLTKCTFYHYGFSGDTQKLDVMCILPINIVNEKIYVFLWFWFYFIAVVSVLAVVYRLATLFFPQLRVMVTHAHCGLNRCELSEVINRSSIGDWFILDLLSRNLDPTNFRKLIRAVRKLK